MKVKWLQSGIALGYGYFEGDEVNLNDKLAKELIDLKRVEQVGKDIPANNQGLPKDFPCRLELEALGYETAEELSKIKDFEKLKGISEANAKAIKDYLKKSSNKE